MLPRFAPLLLLVAAASCRETSSAAAERDTHTLTQSPSAPLTPPVPPCRGCTLDVPRSASGDLPILVVLHGNHEHAHQRAAWWRDAAIARGYVVLGLECPREDGCTDGIWYQWDGAPSWISDQIAATKLSIDPARRYIAAWSGGASYVGMNADKLSGFAAVVFHGGGQPPLGRDDCPSSALPSYFLVGDGNPAHGAAVRLKDYLAKCNQPLAWDLLPGANHSAEAKALDRSKADEILDWLEKHTPSTDVIATR